MGGATTERWLLLLLLLRQKLLALRLLWERLLRQRLQLEGNWSLADKVTTRGKPNALNAVTRIGPAYMQRSLLRRLVEHADRGNGRACPKVVGLTARSSAWSSYG